MTFLGELKMMSRGCEVGVKALRPRARPAERGLDTDRASDTLLQSGEVVPGPSRYMPIPHP
jgi:hypothetical protein